MGQYTFPIAEAGAHTVAETDPDGFRSTTPNAVTIDVVLGNSYQADFGDTNNSSTASIYGTVFNDANANGVQDAGEAGIAGVTVTLDGGTSSSTNTLGQYTFLIAGAGAHTVAETDPDGFRSTTPNAVIIDVVLGNSYQADFGDTNNSSTASIYGTVYNDANANGLQDAGETGIAGVTVTLDGGTSSSTNTLGQYTFPIAEAGAHTVAETDPDGFRSTTPNAVIIDVVLGNSYQADFGDSVGIITTTTTQPTTTTSISGGGGSGGGGVGGGGIITTSTTTTVMPPASTTTTIPVPPPPQCTTDADCDDGLFCNGVETCVDGVCQNGESPCDSGQTCREDVKCIDIVRLSASTALLPRKDERTLRAPILLPNLRYWLRVKIKAGNNIDLNTSVFTVEGAAQTYSGISIDNARFRKIRGAFFKKNRENVFWVPIDAQKNTPPGTYKIKITTDRTDAQPPFIEEVEGNFKIRENLLQKLFDKARD